jgi:hypothetical protein
MRKTFFVLTAFFLVFTWVKLVAASHPDVPAIVDIGDRIEDLQDWIDDGKDSGELTRSDVKRLQSRLDRIKRQFERAKRRGPIPPPVVDDLNSKLDVLEDDIVKQKHDRQRAK